MELNTPFLIKVFIASVVFVLVYNVCILDAFRDNLRKVPWLQQVLVDKPSLTPVCENALVNITKGKWVKKLDLERYKDHVDAIALEEERLELDLKEYWFNNGVQSQTWSKDLKCGYQNFQTRPANSKWPKVGRWCNPNGIKPCCSDASDGTCMSPSQVTCDCPGCVDVRKYKHAETSDWIVEDDRCKWINYDASQICDVIEQSPFRNIYFIGDSFARKMFRTLAIMITDDFENGWTSVNTSDDLRRRCRGMQSYYWTYCRVTFGDMRDLYNPTKLCGGRGFMNFTAKYHVSDSRTEKTKLLNIVKNTLNVNGSLIILSTGYHFSCNSKKVIKEFVGPAIDEINKRYGPPSMRSNSGELSGRWPEIILCLPPTIGLLKPRVHLSLQSQDKCDKYSSDMLAYAKTYGIGILDFRPISKYIHSFDGSHYSFAVNKLNY